MDFRSIFFFTCMFLRLQVESLKVSGCYGNEHERLNFSCQANGRIMIQAVLAMTKPTSSKCPREMVTVKHALPECCKLEPGDRDCKMNYTHPYTYIHACQGQNECDKRVSWQPTTCNTSVYMMNSNYMVLYYQCLPGAHTVSFVSSGVTNGTTIYVQNPNYPNASTTDIVQGMCSVSASSETQIRVSAIHLALKDCTDGTCEQYVQICDGIKVETINSSQNTLFSERVLYNGTSHFLLLKFRITHSNDSDSGLMWLQLSGLNRNASLDLNCTKGSLTRNLTVSVCQAEKNSILGSTAKASLPSQTSLAPNISSLAPLTSSFTTTTTSVSRVTSMLQTPLVTSPSTDTQRKGAHTVSFVSSGVTNGTTIYVQNPNYPNASTTDIVQGMCSVSASSETQIRVSAIHLALKDCTDGTCEQYVQICDGNKVETINSSQNTLFSERVLYNGTSHFLLLKFRITHSNDSDSGLMRLQLTGLNRNASLELNCTKGSLTTNLTVSECQAATTFILGSTAKTSSRSQTSLTPHISSVSGLISPFTTTTPSVSRVTSMLQTPSATSSSHRKGAHTVSFVSSEVTNGTTIYVQNPNYPNASTTDVIEGMCTVLAPSETDIRVSAIHLALKDCTDGTCEQYVQICDGNKVETINSSQNTFSERVLYNGPSHFLLLKFRITNSNDSRSGLMRLQLTGLNRNAYLELNCIKGPLTTNLTVFVCQAAKTSILGSAAKASLPSQTSLASYLSSLAPMKSPFRRTTTSVSGVSSMLQTPLGASSSTDTQRKGSSLTTAEIASLVMAAFALLVGVMLAVIFCLLIKKNLHLMKVSDSHGVAPDQEFVQAVGLSNLFPETEFQSSALPQSTCNLPPRRLPPIHI